MSHCVLDTTVMQKSNAPLEKTPKAGRTIAKRLQLLVRIADGKLVLLWSAQLVHEWNTKVVEPRNEFVRTILELATTSGHGVYNWASPWSGGMRETLRKCRFPEHDNHLVRTALRNETSFVITEDGPTLAASACVKKKFDVVLVHSEKAETIPDRKSKA